MIPVDLGVNDQECIHCGALNFAFERVNSGFSSCCGNGKVQLEELKPSPPEILDLLIVNEDQSNADHVSVFKNHIRWINNQLAFAAINVEQEKITPGPDFYKIHGQLYHTVSALYHNQSQRPRYSQLYVLDAQQAADERLQLLFNYTREITQSIKDNLEEIMRKTLAMISRINPFSKIYKTMDEKNIEENKIA